MSEKITEEQDNHERVYKLLIDERVVCSARTLPYSILLRIETVKEEKGKGYGKKLLKHIEELAGKNRAITMKTSDIDKCDYETVCFFKSMGYRFKSDEQDQQFIEAIKKL